MVMPLRRYAEFSGRSRRLEFWMFQLLNIVIGGLLFSVMFTNFALAFGQDYSAAFPGLGIGFWLPVVLSLIWWVVILVPSIAVTVRRLHDRDMSGWWYLGFIVCWFIPLVNFVAWIAFLVLMLLDGTPGPNRYGEDPKGRGTVEVFR